jgi:ABC-type antimicrobial peptide transport system permease subunit
MSILLVIACANVANLFLARAERQRRDFAIRRAIGAPVRALVRRQLLETTIVATLAGALALGEATWIRAAGLLVAAGALAFAASLARVLHHLMPCARRVAVAPAPRAGAA